MSAKKPGRPLKKRMTPRTPLTPVKIERMFMRIANDFGLSDYRMVLFHGITNPDVLLVSESTRRRYAEAQTRSPRGVARLIKYVADAKARPESLVDYIEKRPHLVHKTAEEILSKFPVDSKRPKIHPEAVTLAKAEVMKRGWGVKRPITKKKP